ncbi:hypothetical protein BUALT_Bualt13G0092400 [Buddleja alternifolia]|uniref:Anthranilate synthase n=1 Tax=Buddleja alternifolia TaxID=168488 RepID=A0AAV6WX00_9LAMI|nr:hypothetical protein BUALT_Bualt13G0092400 [Buddleja alternifolia]
METLALSRNPLLFSHPRLSNATVNTFKTLRTTVKCSISHPSVVDHSVKFKEAAKHGNLIPLYRPIFSDHLTPVLAYRCLVKEDERDAPSFLFESVEPGLKVSSVRTEEFVEDPMVVPRRIMEKWKPQRVDVLPEAFCVYAAVNNIPALCRKEKASFSKAPQDDRNLPDVHLGLYDDVIVFDHVEKKAYVIHWVRFYQFSSVEEAYDDGMNRLEALVSRVHDIIPPRLASGSIKLHTSLFGPSLSKSTMTREEYQKAVIEAKEHILAGDIFQIVLSQRFERRTFADRFEVYRALRIVNPSPYMTYKSARGCILVASSPEILTRVKKGKITNCPLAGTVHRGKTPKEDHMLENQLLHDEKQCAEHIMLVDLGRNDVGKVKAMELIDELEMTRRGPYSGGFGGISFSGDMDIALALRTIVFPTGMPGAGIVADSDPADEQRECENKAAALARAIDLAESSFVDKERGDEVYQSPDTEAGVSIDATSHLPQIPSPPPWVEDHLHLHQIGAAPPQIGHRRVAFRQRRYCSGEQLLAVEPSAAADTGRHPQLARWQRRLLQMWCNRRRRASSLATGSRRLFLKTRGHQTPLQPPRRSSYTARLHSQLRRHQRTNPPPFNSAGAAQKPNAPLFRHQIQLQPRPPCSTNSAAAAQPNRRKWRRNQPPHPNAAYSKRRPLSVVFSGCLFGFKLIKPQYTSFNTGLISGSHI